MKFIISSLSLLRGLQSLSGVLSSSNQLEILNNFLFRIGEDGIQIVASDLETTMLIQVKPDMVEGSGEVAIPARILLETLKTFPDIPITLAIDTNTFGIELFGGEGRYKLVGYSGEEFPSVPLIQDASEIELDPEILIHAIEKTVFAAGNDPMRPIMSGVLCELNENYTTFVATDAHKLVRYRRFDAKSVANASFVLPKKPITHLKNILSSDSENKVKISFNQTNASFSFDNILLICRLIEGRYPNYEAVIPTTNPNKLTIDRVALLNSIRRASIFTNKANPQVRFRITGQELFISAEDLEYSNEARERLNCNYEGDDMEIGFNARFFQEMLSNVHFEEIRLEMSAPNRAGIIMPAVVDNADEDLLMLIMPVMLQQ
ncbi:MAG: DNA polymerase III subunit beta [Bacteroidales bacterium]|jgi:DNA polymerase-3 subunit beta